MKRCFLSILAVVILLALVPVPAFAAENSGQCGVNASWSFDDQTGTLTISGSGTMDDFKYDAPPWKDCRDQITTVVVEKGITGIGENAFYGLTNLVRVSLPDGLISVGGWAFTGCKALPEITFPDTVWSWGDQVLMGCTALTSVKLPEGITEIPVGLFESCLSLKSFEIPDTVTKLSGAAFRNSGLVSITVPGNVKTVESNVLYSCSDLETVEFQEGVQTLGADLFGDCKLLKELVIPASVNSMQETLRNNYSLEKITFRGNLPAGADRIGRNETIKREITIYYPLNTKTWTEEAINGFVENVTCVGYEWTGEQNTTLATGICGEDATWVLKDDYVLTISGTGILRDPYVDCWNGYEDKVKKIVIEDGVAEIGHSIFSGFTGLEEVIIPNSVTDIYHGAFWNCDKLTYLQIPAGVETVHDGAFSSCDSLEQVDIMGVDTKFTMNAFRDCPLLRQVNMLGTEQPEQLPTEPSTGGEQADPISPKELFLPLVLTVAILVAGGAAVIVILIRKHN